MYYRGAAAAVLVVDVTNPDSFAKVRSWVEGTMKHLPLFFLQPFIKYHILVFLVIRGSRLPVLHSAPWADPHFSLCTLLTSFQTSRSVFSQKVLGRGENCVFLPAL
jgi:hypothetical protein